MGAAGLLGGVDNPQLAAMQEAVVGAAAEPRQTAAAEALEGSKPGKHHLFPHHPKMQGRCKHVIVAVESPHCRTTMTTDRLQLATT